MLMKIAKFVLATIIVASLVVTQQNAQELILKKDVIGTGGGVALMNTEKMTMSGLMGQIAIEKISSTGSAGDLIDIYQGFWVPWPELISDVNDPLVYNTFLNNFPNPFSSSTTVKFTIPVPATITIKIFDAAGNKVKQFNLGYMEAGEHEVKWDGKNSIGLDAGSGSYPFELSVQPASVVGNSTDIYSIRNVMLIVK
jgi:hypothetical protein